MMKTQYINYTPIPARVPRQLAIDILQAHSEIITINPLVLEHHPIKAPRDCPNEEYYSTWYEITQCIQFVPGLKKMGSSKVTFRGCFHDMPWGVQTHMYIPMGVDLRNKWQIRGSQPGEPPEPRELGSDAPSSGLYLREEVEIKCNALAMSWVKKETKAASLVMVERMLQKAELLDAGIIQAMFDKGKLVTYNPNDRSNKLPPTPQPMSPGLPSRWGPDSAPPPQDQRSSLYASYHQLHDPKLPNQLGQIAHPEGQGLAVELPGDFLYPSEQVIRPRLPFDFNSQQDRFSQISGSDNSSENRHSRWSFMSSDKYSTGGTPRPTSHGTPPIPDNKHFSAELPGTGHPDFEVTNKPRSPPAQQQKFEHAAYNPQDYARYSGNRRA